MVDGFVNLYQRDWSEEKVANRIESMAAAGLALESPVTGKILTGTLDRLDEPASIGRAELLRALVLEDRTSQSFKYWLDAETDVYCRVRRISPDVVVEEFDLDGLGGPRWGTGQDKVISVVLSEFRSMGDSAVGLVVDRWGTSLESDLDAIILGELVPVTINPDLLVLRRDVAERHPELSGDVAFALGVFVAYDRTGIIPEIDR